MKKEIIFMMMLVLSCVFLTGCIFDSDGTGIKVGVLESVDFVDSKMFLVFDDGSDYKLYFTSDDRYVESLVGERVELVYTIENFVPLIFVSMKKYDGWF